MANQSGLRSQARRAGPASQPTSRPDSKPRSLGRNWRLLWVVIEIPALPPASSASSEAHLELQPAADCEPLCAGWAAAAAAAALLALASICICICACTSIRVGAPLARPSPESWGCARSRRPDRKRGASGQLAATCCAAPEVAAIREEAPPPNLSCARKQRQTGRRLAAPTGRAEGRGGSLVGESEPPLARDSGGPKGLAARLAGRAAASASLMNGRRRVFGWDWMQFASAAPRSPSRLRLGRRANECELAASRR